MSQNSTGPHHGHRPFASWLSRGRACARAAMQHARQRFWPLFQQIDMPRFLGSAALLLAVLGVALRGGLDVSGVFAVAAAVAGLLAVHTALVREQRIGATPAVAHSAPADQLERRIEHLHDLKWELRDNEARYRDLLDSLDEMIVRTNAAGELTFVNRAFCAFFGVDAPSVIGTRWQATVLACEAGVGHHDDQSPVQRQRRACELTAVSGSSRWIEWDEHAVAAPDGASDGVQRIGRDVTERRRYEDDLRQARDAAEAANRAKSRFLAAMSHEIRTPMNGILGMASLLGDTGQTAEQKTYTQAIDQSARTLLSLIDEILDFSKIEAGKLALVTEPFSIAETVQGAVELLAPSAHEKQLEIAWHIEPDVPQLVTGVPSRVRQILLNLISNAVKFTDTGGVRVAARLAPRGTENDGLLIIITVEDTGIGLSPLDMGALFAEFEQADAAIQRRDGGTGLGLAISKRLARAMGGDITVKSEPGRGSMFQLELPVGAVVQAANLTQPSSVRPDGPAVGPAPVDRAAVPRVLLAVDRPMESAAMLATLSARGIAARCVPPGAASTAIDEAAALGVPFDVIIVDGGACATACGVILDRARAVLAPLGRTVRGFVLVNAALRAGLSPFRAQGFEGYLMRPVRPQALLEQVGVAAHEPRQANLSQPDTTAPSGRLPHEQRPRVLLAEDNAVNALLAQKVLERAGYEVVLAVNGYEAVAAAEAELAREGSGFAVILMDIFMPGFDGVEAARRIKALYAGRTCPPVVALTANAFAEDRERYLDLGLDDYLAKPFERAAMAALLERWRTRGTASEATAARPAQTAA